MNTEYFGYIKITKSGRFRGIIASIHDAGELDGDKLLYTEFESPFFHELEEARDELKQLCEYNDIPYSMKAVRSTMLAVWMSDVTE